MFEFCGDAAGHCGIDESATIDEPHSVHDRSSGNVAHERDRCAGDDAAVDDNGSHGAVTDGSIGHHGNTLDDVYGIARRQADGATRVGAGRLDELAHDEPRLGAGRQTRRNQGRVDDHRPGANWTAAGVDANGAGQVLFADSRNGWIVGVNGVQSTHDGGATWATVSMPGGIGTGAAVAAGTGTVHVAYIGGPGTGISIASSPTDRDAFVAAPVSLASGAGPRLDVSMSAGGPYGELIYNDRTFIGAAQIDDGRWSKWDLTCPYDNPVAAAGLSPQGQALAIACSPSGFGENAPVVAADLSTGTLTWVTVAPADQHAQGEALVYFAAATDDGLRIIVYTTANGSAEIASSTDGGSTWPTRTRLPAGRAPGAITHLPNGGLLIASDPGGLVSSDGLNWTPVATTPA